MPLSKLLLYGLEWGESFLAKTDLEIFSYNLVKILYLLIIFI